MRTLSAAALESLNASRTDQAWLTLLEISNVGLEAPIRLVNNPVNIVSGGYTYIGFPFQVDLPRQSGEGRAAQITLDNTDRQIVRLIREIDEGSDVLIKVVLSGSPDTVEYLLAGLKLRNAEWTVSQVTADLMFENVLGEPVADTMTPSRFAGAF